MKTIDKIDFSKFRVDVYNPDGTYVCSAKTNSNFDFYCSDLIAGQSYDLIFSYDEIFLLAIEFKSELAGRVTYIDPPHILIVNQISNKPINIGKQFDEMVKRRIEYEIPIMGWEKRLLQNQLATGNFANTLCNYPFKVNKYKAGNDFASQACIS